VTRLRKIAALVGSIILVGLTTVAYWTFLYHGDLPNYEELSRFAPSSPSQVFDPCVGEQIAAIPADEMGDAFRNALSAAEPSSSWSYRIAGSLLCGSGLKPAHYDLKVMRLNWHIQREFSEDQIFAIYANRAHFDDHATGIAEASAQLFRKAPSALTVDEAALLAGMLRGSSYSPMRHPDRALARRNAVLQKMVEQGNLSQTDASELEARPLLVFNGQSSTSN
jgi:membrane carboxypeptidase/penicillin-binding protein